MKQFSRPGGFRAWDHFGNRGREQMPLPPPQVTNAWDSFMTQLQQFDAHLEEQKTQLLGGILVKQLDEFRWGGEGGGWMCKGEDERVHSIGRSQSPPRQIQGGGLCLLLA